MGGMAFDFGVGCNRRPSQRGGSQKVTAGPPPSGSHDAVAPTAVRVRRPALEAIRRNQTSRAQKMRIEGRVLDQEPLLA